MINYWSYINRVYKSNVLKRLYKTTDYISTKRENIDYEINKFHDCNWKKVIYHFKMGDLFVKARNVPVNFTLWTFWHKYLVPLTKYGLNFYNKSVFEIIDQASFDHVKVGPTPVLALCNLWLQIQMFLDILEFRIENKKKFRENCFENLVSDLLKKTFMCQQNCF